MKKANYFITAAATKYWKKEVKGGNLRIATTEEKIYILNGYNAFVIPNNKYIFADLVQPATMRPAPEVGRAHIWINGNMSEGSAKETTDIVDRILSADTAAVKRTQFTVDTTNGDNLRIYKLESGKIVGINSKYDSMIDFRIPCTSTMATPRTPAVFVSADITAIICPVHLGKLEEWAQALTEGI